MKINELFKNGLGNQPYLFIGDVLGIENSLFDLFSDLGIKSKANPNFHIFNRDNFLIDDAREILDKHSKKSFSFNNIPDKNIFFIKLNTITEEAQNAFLKILEEPNQESHFFIIAPQNIFLPTFLSRVSLFEENSSVSKNDILEKSLVEKMEIVSKLCKDIADEKRQKQDAIDFLNSLEQEVLEKHGLEDGFSKLKIIEKGRENLFQRGAMIKMILENVILHL